MQTQVARAARTQEKSKGIVARKPIRRRAIVKPARTKNKDKYNPTPDKA